jgi:hypothetical protein
VIAGKLDADLSGPTLEHLSGPMQPEPGWLASQGYAIEHGECPLASTTGAPSWDWRAHPGDSCCGPPERAGHFADPPTLELATRLSIPPLGRSGLHRGPGEPILIHGDVALDLSVRGDTLPEAVGRLGLAFSLARRRRADRRWADRCHRSGTARSAGMRRSMSPVVT